MKQRPLGNPTDKAWLAGWDAGICGRISNCNPYKRRPQYGAWERGWRAGRRSNFEDVQIMKLRQTRCDVRTAR